MESKQCAGCGKAFHPRAQTPKQTYCSCAACQRERRRRWQKARREADPDYQDNQSRAQQSWADRHRDYWREYRRTHPAYSERNRVLQRERDLRRRERVLAKMDASARDSPVASGTYRLIPVGRGDLAKRDAWRVQITVLSRQYAETG